MSVMNVDIRGLGIFCTTALSDRVRRRLQFALASHGDCIQQVTVRLGNEHGPRGEFNKFCRIQAQLLNGPEIRVRVVAHDLCTVIDRAADRVDRAVVRHLRDPRITKQQTGSTDGPAASGPAATEESRT